MKYDITQEDRDIMERDMRTDRTLKHLRNLSFYKFSIGDVLIREEKHRNYKNGTSEWKVRTADCNLPYKYVYVFENELGVGYIRRLSVNGSKFVERAMCVTEFDPDQTRFSLDPEYADHMLLAEEQDEFDTKSRYAEAKKKREQINRKNKKLAIPMPDEAAVITWMQNLKVGDQIWWGHSISGLYKDAYYVHEINLHAPRTNNTPSASHNPFGWNFTSKFEPHIKVSTAPPNTLSSAYASTLYSNNLMSYYVFNQRPLFFDEIIN